MREDYLIAIANLVNGSLLGYEDRSRVPEYEKTVDDYVDSLEEKNQKYKEVIDKAKEWINNHIDTFEERNITIYDWNSLSNPKELLDILKEVE